MLKPTRITICEDNRLVIEIARGEAIEKFTCLAFEKSPNYEDIYWLKSPNPDDIYRMCERLRDMGVPYATHRHMGADYQVEWLRDKGHVTGKFKRINFFGNDTDKNASFVIEEF